MNNHFDLNEENKFYYYNSGFKGLYLLWGLFANADRVINSVYLFRNFDEYCRQLNSDRQEDKLEEYWKASYDEKLIDYIKIVVAFETFNKALLLKKGFIIHKVDSKFNKGLHKNQTEGFPIRVEEFYENNFTSLNWRRREAQLNGLSKNLSTINFSHTLNENYQNVLRQDELLVHHLKNISTKRNRLHLYSDFHGAFEIGRHIEKWRFIKEKSLSLIRNEYTIINEELKNCD